MPGSKAKSEIIISAKDETQRKMIALGRRLDATGKKLRKIGRRGSIAGAGIAGGFGLALRAFDKQQKALAQVRQGLKSTGGAAKLTFAQLQKEASDLQKKTLFGDEDILQNATAQLLTFTNISGDNFKRTQQAALDLATRLDGDLKSASIQLGKALNDPVANLSALSRSGIQFSKSQKKVIKDLAESGRLSEAQGIILDELQKQYGGAAEAAAKAGLGPWKQFQNRIGDIAERIGGALLPVLDKIVPYIDKAASALENMDDGTLGIGVAIAGLVAAIGPLLMVLGTVTGSLGTLVAAFGAAGGAAGAVGGILAALTGPVGIAVAAIAAGAYLVIRNWDSVKAFAVTMVGEVVAAFNGWRERNAGALAKISAAWESLKESAVRIWSALSKTVFETTVAVVEKLNEWLEPIGGIKGAWEMLKESLGIYISAITQTIGDAFKTIADNFKIVADVLEGQKSLWDGLKEIVSNNTGLIVRTVIRLVTAIKDAFLSIDWKGIGLAIIQGVAKGIKAANSMLKDAAVGVVKGVYQSVKGFLEVRSPSRLFAELGHYSMAGLAVGITSAAPEAEGAAADAARRVTGAFQQNYAISQPAGMAGQPGNGAGMPGGGGMEGDAAGMAIPGQAELDQLRAYYDQRVAVLQEKGMQETELAKSIEAERNQAVLSLRKQQVQGYGKAFNSVLQLTEQFAGKQSGIYRAMFAASKAFAVAESIIAIQQSIAKAASVGWPGNIPIIAQAVAQGAQIISAIQGTQASFEGGGFTGSGARTGGVDGKGGFNAVLHPNETVVDHAKGQGPGGVTVNITIHGDPNPTVVEEIKAAAVTKALETQVEVNRRGGGRAGALR